MTVQNTKLNDWVKEMADLCRPDAVYWCDGSSEEYDRLMGQMVASGMAIPLAKRPEQLSVPIRSERRGPGRVAHLHQHGPQG